MNNMRIYVDRDFWRKRYKLLAYAKNPDGSTIVAENIQFKHYGMLDRLPHSSDAAGINLDEAAAQSLIDSLWDIGLRPTKGSGSAGSFEAQGKHLEDMRALVFKTLEMEPPK